MARKFLTPVIPPSLASDPSGAVAGAIYYNTVLNALKFYNGTEWSAVGTGTGGGGTGTSNSLEVLATPPLTPNQGRIYFNSEEQTIKVYNGSLWYDVAGPKELLEHTHFAGEGGVRTVDYGNYVEYGNYIVSLDGGSATTDYTITPNDDIIDGGVG